MAFYAVSDSTVIIVNPKAGSRSMMESIELAPFTEVTALEALAYENRVLFLWHPLARLSSMFNMLYRITLNNGQYAEFMPVGTIKAHGSRVKNGVGANEHHWKGTRKQEFIDSLVTERLLSLTDDELELKLNNRDYRRYVELILAGNYNAHWGSQVALSSHEGVLVANIIHKFEDVNLHWLKYVQSPLPHLNSWPPVIHDPYKIPELRALYAADIELWSNL